MGEAVWSKGGEYIVSKRAMYLELPDMAAVGTVSEANIKQDVSISERSGVWASTLSVSGSR